MPSNHRILSSLLLLPSTFPSIRVFSNESALYFRWPECWSFSSISPSNEYSGLISFGIDWNDLFAVLRDTSVFSSTTIWKHQFFSAQPSLWSNSHICTWLLESFDYMDLCWQSDISAFFFFLGRINFNGVISFNSIYTNIIISTCNQYKIIEVCASFFEGL